MALISEETIRQVAAANDIVEVIGSYFPLKRAGSSWRALCPFHREKSPSFFVNPARQSFHCFGCGANGSVIGFVMDYEKIDYPSAIRRLAARANIPLIEEASTPADRKEASLRDRLLSLHAEAAAFYHANLLKKPTAQAARDYLKSRGFDKEVAQRWMLGYAPESWDALLSLAQARGFREEELARSGLFTSRETGGMYDRFRNRLMFPIRNDLGEVIGFSGRVLETDVQAAKYVNSPETPLFIKGQVLYGLDKTKRDLIAARQAIVCEGQLDLISAYEAGIRNVIAPQGTAFTGRQAHTLKRFVDSIVLCFDADHAGLAAAERSLAALYAEGLEVRIAELPAGEDPDSTVRKFGPEELQRRIANARDFTDVAIDRAAKEPDFSQPRVKATLAQRLAAAVRLLPDPVLRDATAAKISSRLGVPHASFVALLRKTPRQQQNDFQEEDIPETSLPELSRNCQFLCAAALRSIEARQFLARKDAAEVLDDPVEAKLVNLLANADFDPEEPAGIASFLAGIEVSFQKLIASMPIDTFPKDGIALATTTWAKLLRQRLEDRKKSVMMRLASLGGSGSEAEALHKEFLEIQKMLSDIPPLSHRVVASGTASVPAQGSG